MKNPYANMKPMTIVALWVAKLIACGFLGWAGYLKVSGSAGEIHLFTELGMEPVGRYVIGGCELLVVVLLLVPQSAVYGAILGMGVMTGAIFAHLTTEVGREKIELLPLAILVFLCCLTVLYIRRHDAEFVKNLIDR